MRVILVLSLGLVWGSQFSSCVTVNQWGLTSDIARLKFALRDLFQQAFKLVADDVYTVPEFKQTYDHAVRNRTATVQFRAYNGRFHNPTIEIMRESGRIRRMIISNEPGLRQHEIIVCGDCFFIETSRLNYLYEAYYGKQSSYGRMYNGPIAYTVGFEMAVFHNNETQKHNESTCKMHLSTLNVTLETNHHKYHLDPQIENTGALNFLADKQDTWLIQHLNTTIAHNLQNSIVNSVAAVAKTHRICDELLTST